MLKKDNATYFDYTSGTIGVQQLYFLYPYNNHVPNKALNIAYIYN